MRFCRNCRNFNAGQPIRCRYCRAALAGKLCPRNHINPADRQLAFCGQCGEPLDPLYGGGGSRIRTSLAGCSAFILGIVVLSIIISAANDPRSFMSMLTLGLLFYAVYSIVIEKAPAPVQTIMRRLNRLALSAVRSLFLALLRSLRGNTETPRGLR